MTKLITTAVATLLAAIIMLQGSAFASGNHPPKTGSSNKSYSSYNKTVNKTVVNNTVINKSGSNSISSGNSNKTFSTSKHTSHYHYWCGWYSGYCGSYGCYRPTFWWFGDGPTAAIVDPDSDDELAAGTPPRGDAASGPVQALEPTPPAKGGPGGM